MSSVDNAITNAIEILRGERAELDSIIAALERRVGTNGGAASEAMPPQTRRAAPAKSKATEPKHRKFSEVKRERRLPGSDPEVAAWRAKVIAPILAHPQGSDERRRALKVLVGTESLRPDGELQVLTDSTLYLWVQQAEGTLGKGRSA